MTEAIAAAIADSARGGLIVRPERMVPLQAYPISIRGEVAIWIVKQDDGSLRLYADHPERSE